MARWNQVIASRFPDQHAGSSLPPQRSDVVPGISENAHGDDRQETNTLHLMARTQAFAITACSGKSLGPQAATRSPFKQLEADLQADHLTQSLEQLFARLRIARDQLSSSGWEAFVQETLSNIAVRELLHEDPMTRRALQKPRGYAGDAVMMDYLYGIHAACDAEAQASETGRAIYRYVQSRPAGQAVRFRREHIAALIDQHAGNKAPLRSSNLPRVLAVACGHLREAELSRAMQQRLFADFVAVDSDSQSLAEVDSRYASLGIKTVHASVRHLLGGKIPLGTFSLVYAAGLYDYLVDKVAQVLTARLFEVTAPGGMMLIPNFAPTLADRAYMEIFMDWRLIYSDEHDMTTLLDRIHPAQIDSYDTYTDPTESMVFLSVRKAA